MFRSAVTGMGCIGYNKDSDAAPDDTLAERNGVIIKASGKLSKKESADKQRKRV
jgi:hypothetical protein